MLTGIPLDLTPFGSTAGGGSVSLQYVVLAADAGGRIVSGMSTAGGTSSAANADTYNSRITA